MKWTRIDQREEILPQNAGYCKSEYEMKTNHLMSNDSESIWLHDYKTN